ncbi:hypothetical protein GCM10009714_12000 [Microlunatus capsulatus]
MGHGSKKHLDVSESEMESRARMGVPRIAEPGVTAAPRSITKFTSAEAFVAAEAVAWQSESTQAQRRIVESGYRVLLAQQRNPEEIRAYLRDNDQIENTSKASDVLGETWRDHVKGYTVAGEGSGPTSFSDDSTIRTYWRLSREGKWYLQSHFPQEDDPRKKGKK